MGKKSFSRTEAEGAEGLEQVKNDIPENRMQAEQQVQNSDEALKTKPVPSGFSLKKTGAKGSKLKQEAIAEVISGGSDSGMGISAGGRGVSGTAGGILTANNSTPIAGQVRGKTRVGKKLDRVANKLNYTPSEQALVEFDESKPLADSASEDQGYNGTYRNEFARSQKKSGGVPGDLLFQRSVDLICKDQLYFTDGQIVLPSSNASDALCYTPSKSYAGANTYADYEAPIGDFLIRKMHTKVNNLGQVIYLFFDVDDVTAVETSADLANKSAAWRLIHSNRAELDRISMDAKAGDEKAEIWSPLPRAVYEPTKLVYFLSAIESQTGAHAYLAYSKATVNFSYQLNRGPKDGQDIITPAVEQMVGSLREYDASSGYTGYHSSLQACFNVQDYKAGSPALMIALYDSVAKFNNKADLLLQPRGPRMHLQTADNNINSLRVPAQLVDVINGNEVFSTIDHEYDPLLPICMTDKAGLIDRININDTGAFCHPHFKVTYSFTNIETNGGENASLRDEEIIVPACIANTTMYVYEKHSAGDGSVQVSAGVYGLKKDGTNRSGVTSEIIVSRSATAPTGFTLIGTESAGTQIVFRTLKVRDGGNNHDRITAFASEYIMDGRMYADKKGPIKYAYNDLRNNYIVTVYHPLAEGIVQYLEQSIGGKLFSIIGQSDLSVPWVFSTQYMTLASLMICAATPWIQQVRLNSFKDVLYYEDNIHEYPFTGLVSMKEAPFKNFVNFEYSSYDEPLIVKQMQPTVAIKWIMPEFFWHVDSTYQDFVTPWYFNQNEVELVSGSVVACEDAAAMSMPSIRSGNRLASLDVFYGMSEKDIRLSFDRLTAHILNNSAVSFIGVYKYGLTTDGQLLVRFGAGANPFTIHDLLSCPRELGLIAEVPGYVLTPSGISGCASVTSNGMGTSFRIKVWTSKGASSKNSSILSSDAVDISRAANYTQRWYQLDANTGNSNEQILGLVFGLNDEGSAQFSPFIGVDDSTSVSNAPTVISHQRSMWTRLQTLPFAISPFDAEPTSGSANIDIYDICYMFGLAGFRASDYRESVYNRSKEVVNQGLLFVSDPWVEQSPIVTHGAASTGVSLAKGYEIGK